MLYDHTWTFEWKTQPAGSWEREESGWVLDGRLHTSPDTGWIIAHDVFHHLPGDTGTYAEEITTFGAELWLDPRQDEQALQRDLATSWFSVMALTIENGSRGVEGLRLTRHPASEGFLRGPQADFLRTVYRMALQEARDTFGSFAEPSVWNELQNQGMEDRAVSRAMDGHRQARLRWPDPSQAQAQFEALSTLAGPAQPGARLVVAVTEGHLHMSREDPQPAPGRAKGPRP